MFTLAETSTGTKEFQMVWYGELLTITQILARLTSQFNNLRGKEINFLSAMTKVVATLKVRSYRKSQNQTSQRPDEELLREFLLERRKQAQQELDLANALLEAKVLWSGDTRVWRLISSDEPTELTVKRYNEMNGLLG
jgi:hypothetical protein